MEEQGCALKIDAEFRRLVFRYSKEELAALEREIMEDGCRQPVVVWCGYIVRGFEQYDICRTYDREFNIKKISFCVREEVISRICREELNSRVLPDNQRRYLIGKRYHADVIIGAHNAAGTDQFKERNRRDLFKETWLYESSAGRTRERLAEEYGLNKCSVARYAVYAQAIDYIASVKPETAGRILAGEWKATMGNVISCHGKSEDEIEKLLTVAGRRTRAQKIPSIEKEATGGVTVKDMPAFDPDAEINSLALTIPSWIRTINRTHSTAEFSLLTLKGRNQLERELHQLQRATRKMLHALKEVR